MRGLSVFSSFSHPSWVLVLIFMVLAVANASATPICSDATHGGVAPLPPNTPALFPGDCTGVEAGSLLATSSAPFNSSSGKIQGTIVSAVYEELAGTLDFMLQVTDNSTCIHTPCDAISRVTMSDFTGSVVTGSASRNDGGNTSATTGLGASDPFVNGTVSPFSAERNTTGDTVGWNFPLPSQITPGSSSLVMIITTNATSFTAGSAFAIDGGVTQVASFEPTVLTPEPTSIALFATGLLVLMTVLRSKRVVAF